MTTEDILEQIKKQFSETIEEAVSKMVIPDVVSWIEKNFIIPETRKDPKLKGRIRLMEYQKDVLREALSTDEKGNYKYSIILWSDIKKSAKSTIAAAVNLYRAHYTEWGEFYIVANDLKQADSRVNFYLRRAIQLNPKIANKYARLGYRTTAPSGSFLEAIPIDPAGEAGSNADMITFSELWGANEDAKQQMWAEMTLSPTKHGKSFRWIESYAGFSEESELLYSLYDLGVKRGKLLWPDKLYEVTNGAPAPLELYVNREAGMLCMWNTKPRCPWQTKEYYASEQQILSPSQFDRIHRNQWVTSTETFVPMEWWFACAHPGEEWPKIDKTRQPMVIALDAAVSDDTFGMWMGHRHPTKMEVMTEYVRRWKPVQGHKIDFQGTAEKPGPEFELRRLLKEYNVVEVAYDPYQLHDMASRLKVEGLAWFREFSQGADRLTADSQFRALIRERRFWHHGEEDFTEHIQNANAKVDIEDRRLRIVKRMEKLKIDLAVAASMGSAEILRLNL